MPVTATMNPAAQSSSSELPSANMVAVARKQRLQDAIFHRLTQFFSLLVLAALAGIIVSLFINA
jgi:phosphate transport system permease protein